MSCNGDTVMPLRVRTGSGTRAGPLSHNPGELSQFKRYRRSKSLEEEKKKNNQTTVILTSLSL